MSALRPQAPATRLLRQRRRADPVAAGPLLGLLLLVLAASLAGPGWAGPGATRIEVLLLAMDCALCVEGLEKRLRSLPGAEDVRLDLSGGRLSLKVRAGSSVADDTLRTLMRQAGIVVRQIRRSPVAP